MTHLKIATWNVNSIRTRQSHVKSWLEANPVDILCLQETKVIDKDFPREPFEELGYQVNIFGQKAYNGVAIFSQQPLENVQMGFSSVLGDETQALDEQKRVITGIIGKVQIVNLYVPNGSSVGSDKYEYKLRWLEALKDYLKQLQENNQTELCVCGDMNIALEDRDIYKPKKADHIMASVAEREALAHVLEHNQLKDAFRRFTEETGHYSWWDYRRGGFPNNRGWRIDHHYLTPRLYEKAISCKIDVEPRTWERPSDHTPVILEWE